MVGAGTLLGRGVVIVLVLVTGGGGGEFRDPRYWSNSSSVARSQSPGLSWSCRSAAALERANPCKATRASSSPCANLTLETDVPTFIL